MAVVIGFLPWGRAVRAAHPHRKHHMSSRALQSPCNTNKDSESTQTGKGADGTGDSAAMQYPGRPGTRPPSPRAREAVKSR
ncbi:hypothetical protein GCM10023079_10750 [Streptomyces chitinivorans]